MATGYIMLDSPNPTTAQGTYPRRGVFGKLSGTCIVHTSEGDWRAGVDSLTGLVRRRSDYGCYHRACDWADIALYYPWEWEAWQDSETNNWAVGIAAACRTSDWRVMPAEIREGYYRNMARMAADFVVYMRDNYGVNVPLRRLSGAEARARVPGFCAHGDSGVARSDPGRDFDWGLFFEYTRQALGGLSPAGSITTEEGLFMALSEQQQKDIYWILCTDEGREFLAGVIARGVVNYEVPWYGNDGVIPPEGQRRSVNLTAVLGWIDTMFGGTNRLVGEVKQEVADLADRPAAAAVELKPEDVAALAEQLKGALAPGLAADLARRLAE